MKIRIVKNDPFDIDDDASDITSLIGKVFEAEIGTDGHADIHLNGEEFLVYKSEYEIINEDIKMNLTNNHLQIIREGIVKLECCSCQLAIRCHIQKKTYCQDISEWLKEKIIKE